MIEIKFQIRVILGSNFKFGLFRGQISNSGYFSVKFQIRVILGSNFKFGLFWGLISNSRSFAVKFQIYEKLENCISKWSQWRQLKIRRIEVNRGHQRSKFSKKASFWFLLSVIFKVNNKNIELLYGVFSCIWMMTKNFYYQNNFYFKMA